MTLAYACRSSMTKGGPTALVAYAGRKLAA